MFELSNKIAEFFAKCSEGPEHMSNFNFSGDGDRPLKTSNVDMLKDIIRTLNIRKATGRDGIPAIVYKHISNNIINHINSLFNAIILSKHFPNPWKRAVIFPLRKKGYDGSKIEHYRPISILPIISKLFEKIFYILNGYFLMDSTPDFQFGFKAGKSTANALVEVGDFIKRNIGDGKVVIGITLDICKAFDKMNRLILLNDLNNDHQVNKNFIEFMAGYLSNRSFQVKIESEISNIFNTFSGVPQGSVLSPQIFNYAVKDLPKLDDFWANSAMQVQYADDYIMLVACDNLVRFKPLIQNHINGVIDFLNSKGLQVNYNKSSWICFYKKLGNFSTRVRRSIKNFFLELNGQTIIKSDSLRYLGIILDNKMNFVKDNSDKISRAKAAFFGHYNLFKSKYLPVETKLLLYKTIVRPILTYGFAIKINISSHQMHRIRLVERLFLRIIYGVRRRSDGRWPNNRHLFVEILPIDKFVVHLLNRWLPKHNVSNDGINDNDITNKLHQTSYVLNDSFIDMNQNSSVSLLRFYSFNRNFTKISYS